MDQSGIMIQVDCQVKCNPVTAPTQIHTDLKSRLENFQLLDVFYCMCLVCNWYILSILLPGIYEVYTWFTLEISKPESVYIWYIPGLYMRKVGISSCV